MTTTQPPLLLCDNYLDTIGLYPSATLLASSERVGAEARRVADYRRERTYWMPASAGDRPHLDTTRSAIAASIGDCQFLRGAAGTFARANTSHTFAFLVRSTAAIAAIQTLFFGTGANNASGFFAVRRCANLTGNWLGFFDGTEHSFGVGAPTDDAWHTLVYVFDGAAGTANLYIDGVAAGTPNVAYSPTSWTNADGWYFLASASGNPSPCKLGRVLYYSGTQNAGGVSVIHQALMNEDRSAGDGANSTASACWDPLVGQGGQVLTETKIGASPSLGDSSSVEWSVSGHDDNDPFWGGGLRVTADFGSGATQASPDSLWIDRGHNLWGQYVVVEGSMDPSFAGGRYTDRSFAALQVPALDASGNFVAGGDPTTGFCVTEEGALYTLLSGSRTTSRAWSVRVLSGSTSFVPIVPGIILGQYTQLPNFLSKFDEDAGERTEPSTVSAAGYPASARVYHWRTCQLALSTIGDTDYDATIRQLRRLLFQKNQPAVIVHNYGLHPERAWLYRYSGRAWAFGTPKYYREGTIPMRELGHLLTA